MEEEKIPREKKPSKPMPVYLDKARAVLPHGIYFIGDLSFIFDNLYPKNDELENSLVSNIEYNMTKLKYLRMMALLQSDFIGFVNEEHIFASMAMDPGVKCLQDLKGKNIVIKNGNVGCYRMTEAEFVIRKKLESVGIVFTFREDVECMKHPQFKVKFGAVSLFDPNAVATFKLVKEEFPPMPSSTKKTDPEGGEEWIRVKRASPH